jgi:hypothetical protein
MTKQKRKPKTGMREMVETVRRQVGRPKKGHELPKERIEGKKCDNCGAVEKFAKTRGPMITKTLRIEWLRCTACNRRKRFEIRLK